ncbi:MAG: tRNA (adenosine(37)-N6)-threonylcarbamoyltransferase complex dimerization subunit type 1 TsaB [Actinobacteria bacterium]|nr:tRNA (adenosine(37)-N6)-threonylcarbamoyltransferase complex dimerization subunit type 1 TsaB [Actinomycetota bacterium]
MLLLAIDTATSAITVALHDGARVLAQESVVDPRAHGEQLAPAVQRALSAGGVTPADVTHVVAGIGPGPFTGLRVGLVTARAFAWARGLPAYGVCSLDALAQAAYEPRPDGDPVPPGATGTHPLLVATDARRREIYWARYELASDRRLVRTAGPAVGRAADLPEEVRALPCAGRGPLLYPDALTNPHGPLDVAAGALADLAVARLAAGENLDPPEPLYLRRPDAVPTPAKPVSASEPAPAGRPTR